MTEIERPPVLAARGEAWSRAEGLELHLGVEQDFRPTRKGHPGILVDDLEEVTRRVATTGQDVTWDRGFPGFRRFHAQDPLRQPARVPSAHHHPVLGTSPMCLRWSAQPVH